MGFISQLHQDLLNEAKLVGWSIQNLAVRINAKESCLALVLIFSRNCEILAPFMIEAKYYE